MRGPTNWPERVRNSAGAWGEARPAAIWKKALFAVVAAAIRHNRMNYDELLSSDVAGRPLMNYRGRSIAGLRPKNPQGTN